jgi:hypothetical protein
MLQRTKNSVLLLLGMEVLVYRRNVLVMSDQLVNIKQLCYGQKNPLGFYDFLMTISTLEISFGATFFSIAVQKKVAPVERKVWARIKVHLCKRIHTGGSCNKTVVCIIYSLSIYIGGLHYLTASAKVIYAGLLLT